MKKQIEALYKAFDEFNERKFDGEVPRPTITIQTRGNAKAYGWCSVHPIWNGEEKTHEINISAEYANRPFLEILGTLLHEMVHLHNISNGIKDCSRGGTYHNKNFKAGAERVGLIVSKSQKYGFSRTEVSEELAEEIREFGIDENTFNTARIDFEQAKSEAGETVNPKTGQAKKKSNVIKWTCPECGAIVRSTKESVNIICGDCMVPFEMEE